jgi:nucleotide-binding universal stress UspA family protein
LIGKVPVKSPLKVLLAIDSSKVTRHTVQLLLQAPPEWQVTVLHVIDVEAQPHPHLSGGLIQEYHDRLRQTLRKKAERLVPKVQARLDKRFTQIETVIRDGATADRILTAARVRQVDLLVLGSRGLSPIPALVLGSVSSRVIHLARCSVLLVKKPVPNLRTILLGVDHSAGSRDAVQFLLESGLASIAKRIVAVTVGPAVSSLGGVSSAGQDTQAGARAFVRDMQQQFAAEGYSVEGVAMEGDPAAVLLELAQQESADLIVMGTRGRTGLRRLLLGSVSQKVMTYAPCAVLTVRHPIWKSRVSSPHRKPEPDESQEDP